MPITISGLVQAEAMEVIEREEVLDAKTHVGFTIFSSSEKRDCFTSSFSMMASIIKSQFLKSTNELL